MYGGKVVNRKKKEKRNEEEVIKYVWDVWEKRGVRIKGNLIGIRGWDEMYW